MVTGAPTGSRVFPRLQRGNVSREPCSCCLDTPPPTAGRDTRQPDCSASRKIKNQSTPYRIIQLFFLFNDSTIFYSTNSSGQILALIPQIIAESQPPFFSFFIFLLSFFAPFRPRRYASRAPSLIGKVSPNGEISLLAFNCDAWAYVLPIQRFNHFLFNQPNRAKDKECQQLSCHAFVKKMSRKCQNLAQVTG